MAKTKSAGSTKLGRDSIGKRLGVKLFGGEFAQPGSILVKQRGTKFLPGKNVCRGKDDTLYSTKSGLVQFKTVRKRRFDGTQRVAKIINIMPSNRKGGTGRIGYPPVVEKQRAKGERQKPKVSGERSEQSERLNEVKESGATI